MQDCVFCKIVAGVIPSVKIYEDDLILAFLDIAPVSKGHTLIIPKEHHISLTTVPAEYLARMMQKAPVIAAALMRATGSAGFNLLLSNGTCAGQVVPHVHLHVIPRQPTDGVAIPVHATDYDSEEEKAEIVAAARKRLLS